MSPHFNVDHGKPISGKMSAKLDQSLNKAQFVYKFVSAFLLTVGVFPLSGVANDQFLVVLGSYSQRDIAVLEYALFQAKQPESKLSIVVNTQSSGTLYRVVAGPESTYSDARLTLEAWQNLGEEGAWVMPGSLPEMRVPNDYAISSKLSSRGNSRSSETYN